MQKDLENSCCFNPPVTTAKKSLRSCSTTKTCAQMSSFHLLSNFFLTLLHTTTHSRSINESISVRQIILHNFSFFCHATMSMSQSSCNNILSPTDTTPWSIQGSLTPQAGRVHATTVRVCSYFKIFRIVKR